MQVTDALARAAGLGGEALRTPDGQASGWRDLADRVARGAAGLLEELGPAPVVALLAENSLDYLVAVLAAIHAGGRAMPLNHRLGDPEIEALLMRGGPDLLLTDAANDGRAAGWPGRRMRLDAPDGWGALEQVPPVPSREVAAGGAVLTLFTGGTTGLPRGVDLSAAALLGNARIGVEALSLGPRDICCFTAPFFHIGGLALAFCAMVAGAGGVVVPRFDPQETPRAIAGHRASLVFLTPTMMAMVLDAPGAQPKRMQGLRRIFYGASPISPALLRRIDAAWPGVDLIQAYGQTEICPLAILPAEDHRRALAGEDTEALGAAGYPTPGHELRIVDAAGRECPTGTPGEVWARGPTAMLGYRDDPEATQAALAPGGFVRTGDVGFLDGRGRLHLVDRLKDMIVTGGENVYSTEVENILAAHPAVARVAVIGLPDPRWGERVHAVVELRPEHPPADALAAEIGAFARSRLGGFKCPRSIAFSEGPLPLTGAGKVAKAELRRAAWAGQGRQVG
ncbi:MAG: AMP-binding protein [Rhodobacteraceae bacterium]|nr:AMP-binding protein [Paracoccaceae bacterium]